LLPHQNIDSIITYSETLVVIVMHCCHIHILTVLGGITVLVLMMNISDTGISQRLDVNATSIGLQIVVS
jgi:hypothetical protein